MALIRTGGDAGGREMADSEEGSHPIHPKLDWIHLIGSKIIGLKLHWIYTGLDLSWIGLAADWIYPTLDLS